MMMTLSMQKWKREKEGKAWKMKNIIQNRAGSFIENHNEDSFEKHVS